MNPSVLILCDPNWSTGSMARDLQALLPNWLIVLHDWSTVPDENLRSMSDVICCMTLTCAARIPALRYAKNAVHVNLHPNEHMLSEVQLLAMQARGHSNLVLGAVSLECRLRTRVEFGLKFDQPFYTPVAVWMDRFKRNARARLPDNAHRRAGFVGFPEAESVQVTGATKQPWMFIEICKQSGFEPVFSRKDFTYETMQQFYDSIDVLVCTSSTDGGPLPPLEAIACGVPAISTDVGNMSDFQIPGRFNTIDQAVTLLKSDLSKLADAQYQLMREQCGGHHKAALWEDLFCSVLDRKDKKALGRTT